MSSDILDKILRDKREEIHHLLETRGSSELRRDAEAMPPARGFRAALESTRATGRMAVIAEIKRASPSKGLIREDFEPAALAAGYAAGGAACLSVLTDEKYFQGAEAYLIEAREACALPALRKDFIIDPSQVFEARAMGADCILLIVAALDQGVMASLTALAMELGMDVLVEVHDETEMTRALQLDERCILGINNRNLRTFETSLDVSLRLRQQVPADRLLVSESGIHGPEDIARLRVAGIGACLVGESLMRQADVTQALRHLLGE